MNNEKLSHYLATEVMGLTYFKGASSNVDWYLVWIGDTLIPQMSVIDWNPTKDTNLHQAMMCLEKIDMRKYMQALRSEVMGKKYDILSPPFQMQCSHVRAMLQATPLQICLAIKAAKESEGE